MKETFYLAIVSCFAAVSLVHAQQPTAPATSTAPTAPREPQISKPKAMFTVSVVAEAAKVFRKAVKESKKYKESECDEREPGHVSHKVEGNFPRKIEKDDENVFVRIFYQCTNPSPETYGIFGAASLIAAQVKVPTEKGDKTLDSHETVRVVADTVIDSGGAGCQVWICPNGTPKRALDPYSCPAC